MTYSPADIKAVQQYIQGKTGLPWASLGIQHFSPGGGGYHEGHDLLHAAGVAPEDPGSDYSYTESQRDRNGLTDAASAFDLGDFDVTVNGRRVTHLDVIGAVLVECAKPGRGRCADLREMIYSVDDRNVKRWDALGVRSSGDSSHLTHTHFSWFRDSEGRRNRQDNFLGLITEVFEGSKPMALRDDEDFRWLAGRVEAMAHLLPAVAFGPEQGRALALVTAIQEIRDGVKSLLARPSVAPVALAEADRQQIVAAATPDLDALAHAVAVKLAPLLPTADQIARASADEEAKRLGNG